jgi:transcriptional regulator GlxA family with amidase domain
MKSLSTDTNLTLEGERTKDGIVIAMHICVLVLNEVFDTGLSAVVDAFSTANELAVLSRMNISPFKVSLVGVRNSVVTSQGFSVPLSRAIPRRTDCIFVPALGLKMPEPLGKALASSEVKDATDQLRAWAAGGITIAAACIGTFVLAESGLLDGHTCTTTWWLAPFFRARYPLVKLNESRMIVKSGNRVTSGAALSHLDLALWLIRQKSPKLASLTGRYLIVDSRPSQAAYALSDHLVHSDPVVERFEKWARQRLEKGFSLEEAAHDLGTSKRTLARRLDAVLGRSPLSFFQDLRVEKAVHLLKTTSLGVDEIAAKVGYADGVTLRTLLRRKLKMGIKEVRKP